MRPDLIPPLLLVGLAVFVAAPAWSDDWADPGGPTEAICDVSHVAEDHSGESANGFVFDGVPFTSSNLSNVDFKNASLECIPESNGWACDGRCVDFTASILEGAQLQRADAIRTEFVGAKASGASFASADLGGAVMVGADLTATIWDGATTWDDVTETAIDLSQVDLSDARGRSDTESTDFSGASLRGARLLRVDFGASGTTHRTVFAGADLRQSNADCRYDEVEVPVEGGQAGETTTEIIVSDCPDFSFADFTGDGGLFAGADLRGVIWRGVDLGGASFDDATIRFDGARIDEADFTGGGIAGADFDGAVLAGGALTDSIFVAESPSDASIVKASFAGTSLERADLSEGVLCHPLELVDADQDGDVCNELETTPTECVDWAGVAVDPVSGLPSLAQASLFGAWAPGIDLAEFQMAGGDVRLADLRCAKLEGADLSETAIDATDFGGASFVLVPGAPQDPIPADLSGAVGGCLFPPEVDGTQPDPRCTRFEAATLEGVSFESAILDGASFVDARLAGADFGYVQSLCPELPVDPDLNGGIDQRTFCLDFTGADLGPDANGDSADFTGGVLTGPIFDSADADGVDLGVALTRCVNGELPGDDPNDPVDHRFCASFLDATITRADFTDSIFQEARFGCLDDDGVGEPDWRCTDLSGARFDRASLTSSQWVGPVDLTDFEVSPTESTPTDLSGADLSAAEITCRGFTYTEVGSEEILAVDACPMFAGAVLTPGLDLSGASIFGIDLTDQDLTGADLSGATIGCFTFKYDDENGQEQSLDQRCTDLTGVDLTNADLSDLEIGTVSFAGLTLVGVDLSRADLRGIDLSESDLTGALLVDAEFDADTRFYADYDPDPELSADEKKESCGPDPLDPDPLAPVNLKGADLAGVDVREVVDFGGDCILYDIYTTYDEDTKGLTDTQKLTMTFVPEPGTAVLHAAALLTVAMLARRRRAR